MSKIYTFQYDANYDPAMPVIDIGIGRAMAEISLSLIALVDSGADATMIPVRYLQQIRARRSRAKWMRGTAGGRIMIHLYPISLRLGPLTLAHLEVVGDTQNDEVIVGRDVLNQLVVTFNGPSNSVEVVDG